MNEALITISSHNGFDIVYWVIDGIILYGLLGMINESVIMIINPTITDI